MIRPVYSSSIPTEQSSGDVNRTDSNKDKVVEEAPVQNDRPKQQIVITPISRNSESAMEYRVSHPPTDRPGATTPRASSIFKNFKEETPPPQPSQLMSNRRSSFSAVPSSGESVTNLFKDADPGQPFKSANVNDSTSFNSDPFPDSLLTRSPLQGKVSEGEIDAVLASGGNSNSPQASSSPASSSAAPPPPSKPPPPPVPFKPPPPPVLSSSSRSEENHELDRLPQENYELDVPFPPSPPRSVNQPASSSSPSSPLLSPAAKPAAEPAAKSAAKPAAKPAAEEEGWVGMPRSLDDFQEIIGNLSPHPAYLDPTSSSSASSDSLHPASASYSELYSTAKINELQKMANDRSGDLAVNVFSDIIGSLEKLPGVTIKDMKKPEYNGGKMEAEPFKLPGDPKTYYRVVGNYTLIVKKPDGTEEEISLKRTYSFLTTDPKEAILNARHSMYVVEQSVRKEAGLSTDENWEKMSPEFKQAVKSSRILSFQSSYDSATQTSRLTIRTIDEKNKTQEHSIDLPKHKHIIDKDGTIKEMAEEDVPFGQEAFDTPEAASIHKQGGYSISIDNLYNQLEKEEDHGKEYVADLQKQINKKFNEFEEGLEAEFIPKKTRINLFGKKHKPKEAEAVLEGAEIYKNLEGEHSVDATKRGKLSDKMQEYLTVKNDIKKSEAQSGLIVGDLEGLNKMLLAPPLAEGDQSPILAKYGAEFEAIVQQNGLENMPELKRPFTQASVEFCKKILTEKKERFSQQITEKQKKLEQLKSDVKLEKKKFNQTLGKLSKMNKELRVQVNLLNELKKKAKLVVKPESGATPEDIQRAQAFLRLIPKELEEWEKKIKKQEDEIKKISEGSPYTSKVGRNANRGEAVVGGEELLPQMVNPLNPLFGEGVYY